MIFAVFVFIFVCVLISVLALRAVDCKLATGPF